MKIFDYSKELATVTLKDRTLVVFPTKGNSWVAGLIESMRQGRSDTELFSSLPSRLQGKIWASKS